MMFVNVLVLMCAISARGTCSYTTLTYFALTKLSEVCVEEGPSAPSACNQVGLNGSLVASHPVVLQSAYIHESIVVAAIVMRP